VVDLPDVVPDILVEQRDFYRADAVQSDRWLSSLIDPGNDDVDARTYRSGRQRVADLLAAVGPLGRVLEIAAGTGRLAQLYLPLADSAVLVDSSTESLALATERVRSIPDICAGVELIEADVFEWDSSGQTFDTIFFSAWFHHVPHDVFDLFWGRVEGLLASGGVVVFDFLDARVPSPGHVDIPAAATEDYTFYAPVDGVSVRDLGGRRWRVVHNLWQPDDLARRLHGHGWQLAVHGPGLLSNMVWATAYRLSDAKAGRRAQSDGVGALTGDANLPDT